MKESQAKAFEKSWKHAVRPEDHEILNEWIQWKCNLMPSAVVNLHRNGFLKIG